MTNEHKDLPALPECDASYNNGRFYSAETMRAYARAPLAARPESAGAGVDSINTQDFKAKLSDYNVGMVSVAGLIAHIDAHVTAQVAKAQAAFNTALAAQADACQKRVEAAQVTLQAQQPVASGEDEQEDELTTLSNELLALKHSYLQLELKLGVTEHLLATLRATINSQDSLIKHLTNAVGYHKKRAK